MSAAEFATWLAAQPPIVQPLPVPDVLPAWRILSVMDLHGYTPTVEAIIDSLPERAKKVAKRQIAGSNIERDHALVLAAQAALGSFSRELLARHIRRCVVSDIKAGNSDAVDDLIDTLQKLMK